MVAATRRPILADQGLSGTAGDPLEGRERQFTGAGLTKGRISEFVSMLTMSRIDPETIGQLLHETARVWRHKLDQRLRPLGLSQAKWRTIAHLAHGHLTQCDLAERLSIEEPTLARLLASLESERLDQTRRTRRHDRRCKTVHLQPQIEPLLQQIEDTARELAARIIGDDSGTRSANLPASIERNSPTRPNFPAGR